MSSAVKKISGLPSDLVNKGGEKKKLVFQNAVYDFEVDFLVAVNNEIPEFHHVTVFGPAL